jgi:tRNA-2-methylthio-N6-dimethylallyladenosine synthase
MSTRKAYIKTFGCQMNVHDSEKMAGILEAEGYEITDERRSADLIVYNTCSIREKAEQKFMSDLGRLKSAKSRKPELRIAVAGCIAQQMGQSLLKRAPHVDFVLGPQNIHSLGEMTREGRSGGVATSENPDATLLELPASRKEGRRAWVSIMYGCNNFCTYCIVPYTRGRETSRKSENILQEIKGLAANGFCEVTLLGQNVNSYKSDIGFVDLLSKINEIQGIKRIRFITNHPGNLSRELAEAIGGLEKVCEHIHLPLQSGSDSILKSMNRRYSFKDYMQHIDYLRKYTPEIAITSDIIAGFPGETSDDHKLTVNAIKSIGFDGLFAFRYSPRPGTKACSLEGQVDDTIKQERLLEILSTQDEITLRKNRSIEGSLAEVMLEQGPEDNKKIAHGRTRTNKIVNIINLSKGSASIHAPISEGFVTVRVTQGNKHSLLAELVQD